jgi:hypothetical protein
MAYELNQAFIRGEDAGGDASMEDARTIAGE